MKRSEFVQFMRRHMQDTPEANALLSGHELTDASIESCIRMAEMEYNMTPPVITGFTIENHPAVGLLIYGTMIEMLMSAGILNSRNRLNYNAGGVQVNVSDKAGEYSNWISLLLNRYNQLKLQHKQALNMNRAYGSVGSEYGNAFNYGDLTTGVGVAPWPGDKPGSSGGTEPAPEEGVETYLLANDTYEWSFSKQLGVDGVGPYLQFDHVLNKETGHKVDMSASPIWQMDLKLDLTDNENPTTYAIPFSLHASGNGELVYAPEPLKFTDGQDYVSVDSSEPGKLVLKWTKFTYDSIKQPKIYEGAKGGLFTVEVLVELEKGVLEMSVRTDITVDEAGLSCPTALQSIRFPYLSMPNFSGKSHAYTTTTGGELVIEPVRANIFVGDTDMSDRTAGGSGLYPGDTATTMQAWFDEDNKYGVLGYDLDPYDSVRNIINTSVKANDNWFTYNRLWCQLEGDDFRPVHRRRGAYTRSWNTATNFFTDINGNPYGFKHKCVLFEGDETEAAYIFRKDYIETFNIPTVYDNQDIPEDHKESPLSLWLIDNAIDNKAENSTLTYGTGCDMYDVVSGSVNYFRAESLELHDPIEINVLSLTTNGWMTPTAETYPCGAFFGASNQVGYLTEAENIAEGYERPMVDRMRKGIVPFLQGLHDDASLGEIAVAGNQDTGRIVENTIYSSTNWGGAGNSPVPFHFSDAANEYPRRNLSRINVNHSIYDYSGLVTHKKDNQSRGCAGSAWLADMYIREAKVIIDAFEGTVNYIKFTGSSSHPVRCIAPLLKDTEIGTPKVCVGVLNNASIVKKQTSLWINDIELKAGVAWAAGATERATAENIKEAIIEAGFYAYTEDVPAIGQIIIELDLYDKVKLTLPAFTADRTLRALNLSHTPLKALYNSKYPSQNIYCENGVVLTFDHPMYEAPPLGRLTIHGVESPLLTQINAQPDKWREFSFGYADLEPLDETITWHTDKTINASSFVSAINTVDAVSSTAIIASAIDTTSVKLQSNFLAPDGSIERGSKTRISLNAFSDYVYVSELEALPEGNIVAENHVHPTGSSSYFLEKTGAAMRELQAYGKSIASNGSFYCGTERNNMKVGQYGQGENEHHNMHPNALFLHNFRIGAAESTKRENWLSQYVIPYSTRTNVLPHTQKSAPRAFGTMDTWFRGALVRLETELGQLPPELQNEDSIDKMSLQFMAYAQLYFLIYEAAPPSVFLCWDEYNDILRDNTITYEGRLMGDPRFDSYPGSPSLEAKGEQLQAFFRTLVDIFKAYRKELHTSFTMSGNPTKDFCTSPNDFNYWFQGQDNTYSQRLRSLSELGLTNVIGAFRKIEDGTNTLTDNAGLIFVGNYSFDDNPEVNLKLDLKRYLHITDENASFSLTEYDKDKNQIGESEIIQGLVPYIKTISVDSFEIRIFKVHKI
jgi:hypothetical protein